MKRGQLFILEYLIDFYEKKGVKLRGKIQGELRNNCDVMNTNIINMYKKYFKIQNTILKLKNKYMDLAISLV